MRGPAGHNLGDKLSYTATRDRLRGGLPEKEANLVLRPLVLLLPCSPRDTSSAHLYTGPHSERSAFQATEAPNGRNEERDVYTEAMGVLARDCLLLTPQ